MGQVTAENSRSGGSVPRPVIVKGGGAKLGGVCFTGLDRRDDTPHNDHPRFLVVRTEDQAALAGLLICILHDHSEQSRPLALKYEGSAHGHEGLPPGGRTLT